MKQKFLAYSINKIKINHNYDDVRIAELKYGLESFYMLSSKLVVIFILSILLKLHRELLLFLAFYIPLRGFGFGFHANSSFECWIISIITLIIFPFLAKTIYLPKIIIQILIIVSLISFLSFAPADTKNRPLINKRKRTINKLLIVTVSFIYLILTFFIKSSLLINSIMLASIWQAICINPLCYKLFKQPYNNYKNYVNTV